MARRKRRHPLIKHYYPDEVTVEEFIKILKADSKMFIDNMKGVKEKDKYVEEWVADYFQWLEMIRP